MVGDSLALGQELMAAMLRATLLEGKMYGVEVEGKIATLIVWFRFPARLFARYVPVMTPNFTRKCLDVKNSAAQRRLGYEEFFKKITPQQQAWWNGEVSNSPRTRFLFAQYGSTVSRDHDARIQQALRPRGTRHRIGKRI